VLLIKSLPKIIALVSVVLISTVSTFAQAPLRDLVSQVKRAVVIVSAYDQRGNSLKQGSGFFIAPDRIITNFQIVDSAAKIYIKTFNGQTVPVQKVIPTGTHADLAILQIASPFPDTTSVQVAEILTSQHEIVVVSTLNNTRWKVMTGPTTATWTFEHLDTRLQITASLERDSNGEAQVNLKGHSIGIASRQD
jgi:S1-C subfamily serine protease